ncbi:MAG TPA: acyltransferase [Candidatus Egerieimonas faecigallinarum]|nr:acyltransferase [Candidatus Egerieimonas faecigallinarum]
MEKPTETQRFLYMDILNIAACFAVLVLHCSGTFFTYTPDSVWKLSLLLQVLARWAVLVFLMLTGANLLSYCEKYSTAVFFRKRLLRTFLPFLLWSGIWLVWKVVNGQAQISGVRDVITAFTSNGCQNIYWFFYMLFAIYLAIPVISPLFRAENIRRIRYFYLVILFFTAILPLFTYYTGIPVSSDFTFPLTAGNFGFVILGWLMARTEFKGWQKLLIWLSGILGAVWMYFGAYHDIARSAEHTAQSVFLSYNSLPTAAMSAAVFLLAKSVPWGFLRRLHLAGAVRALAGASFGIYLIHMFPIQYINRAVSNHSAVYMLIMPFLVYAFCALIVVIVRKIPVLRRIFP